MKRVVGTFVKEYFDFLKSFSLFWWMNKRFFENYRYSIFIEGLSKLLSVKFSSPSLQTGSY